MKMPEAPASGVAQNVMLLSRFRLLVSFIHFVPIDNAPPCSQIFRTPVVVFQVVCMLPNVIAENWMRALRNGIVLICGTRHLQVTALQDHPGPSAAELFRARIVELRFQIV